MKTLLLIGLLFTAVFVHGQVIEQNFTIDLSDGDTTVSSVNITGFLYPSIQITALGLDSATATFALLKSNDLTNYGSVPLATGTFGSGDSIKFIEFANPFANTALRLVITANTVTQGFLRVNLNLIQ